MYDKNDPRAALPPETAAKPRTGLIAEEQLGRFYEEPPQIDDATGKTWFLRGHNFVLAYSQVAPGATLGRSDQPDEYVAILPESPAAITTGGGSAKTGPMSIVMIPPGDSAITLPEGGDVYRFFTTESENLVAMCPNANAYDTPRSHVPPFQPCPTPPDGLKLRTYSYDVPPEEGRFGRIFRCTTFMVNLIYPYDGPRDPSKMSPHHHDDFEQFSILIEGEYDHHLRWPWTTDMADWKDDVTYRVGAPSALVIPPPVIHTSRACGAGTNRLIDVFCPPRSDFSAKPGWVLNAADYPLPD